MNTTTESRVQEVMRLALHFAVEVHVWLMALPAADQNSTQASPPKVKRARAALESAVRALAEQPAEKLWLWQNFVDGRREYWAFNNAFPVHLDGGDPQTLGEPCGYAIFKPSRAGRQDVPDTEVMRRSAAVWGTPPAVKG